MALRSTLPAVAAVIATAVAGWLYLDNRKLAREVASVRRDQQVAANDSWARPRAGGSDGGGFEEGRVPSLWARRRAPAPLPTAAPTLPPVPAPSEGRMERRAKRTQMIDMLLGRDADESDDAYRERILPMMAKVLDPARERVEDMRKQAEAAAGVTDEQRKQLDQAFDSIYDEVIGFTDGAVSDGQLTPYGRNVKGMLQYAGGLGSILEGAEGRVGKILSPEQLRAMSDAGFEWGEYLGFKAPWERLRPPPPRPGS
jgi:hypothetical protein